MNNGLKPPHGILIVKNNCTKSFSVHATISGDYLIAKRFCYLHRDWLSALIELMYDSICIDIAFNSHGQQHLSDGSFSASNISSQAYNSRHQYLLLNKNILEYITKLTAHFARVCYPKSTVLVAQIIILTSKCR